MQYQNILLIDDDVEDQEIFNTALEIVSDKLQCTSYTNAKEALQKLQDLELRPDIIFIDLNMPIMNGHEFLTGIKMVDHLRAIPVIIFSTSSSPATIASAKGLGAIDFITKPNRFDDLVALLQPIINPSFT